MKMFLSSVAVFAAIVTGPVFAFDDSQRAAVKSVFDRLIDGIKSNDYEQVFSVTPPSILKQMAEPTGMDVAAFQAIAVEQMKAAMAQVKINDVTYDLDGMQTATTDSDRDYAIVSTTTVMEIGGAAVKAKGPALAFEDDGKWYGLQIQSPDQAALLAKVYPDLADVDLPAPELSPVE